ncbi:MAG: hypothetical protein RL662_866 [Bacteroidota bacterium]|jgi:hypothetical protein
MKKIMFLGGIFMLILIFFALFVLFLRNKEKEQVYISHEVIVRQIEELGNLEVVKYNIQDMMEYQKVRRWLPNSIASLKVVGEVIACVDLAKIADGDVQITGDSVHLMLPIPEICHYKIDHSRSKVYNIEYGLWESAELVDEAYKDAEQQLYQEALNMGIAEESKKNAIKVLTPILKALGYSKIHIEFKPSLEGANEHSIKINRRK